MCGIAVILKSAQTACAVSVLDRMRETVAHRGPDDFGTAVFRRSGLHWLDTSERGLNWQVGLAHRRLSIIDLSPAGHQPMFYLNRFCIVFNGEIYNYIELQADLERLGYSFRSNSDTEVILAAYAEWGTDCFAKLRGMWAIVIFDMLRSEIILSRDRMGIKPLYLWAGDDLVAIASEIKQFLHLPGFTAKLDPVSGSEFLNAGYENPDRSFFDGVRPLPAGTWIRLPIDSLRPSSPVSFWHPERVQVTVSDKEEAGRLFAQKLLESVQIHLRSDVPVGCALSGGLDSTSIVELIHQLQQNNQNELHTFTATFPGANIDEKEYAEEVASHIHSTQHFITPDPQSFLQDLGNFLWIHDEPVGGLSIYASYCLARLTRQRNVPVTLNGQGGDEILSGYWQTYFLYLRELFLQGKWTTIARHYAGALLFEGNPELIRQTPIMFKRYLSRNESTKQTRAWATGSTNALLDKIFALQGQERRVYEIRTMFLPRLLKWDDRSSMAFGVEGRYPFLDHELIELCLSFSPETLYSNGWTKWPIRSGLVEKLPEKILKRRTKLGFETPQNEWLCYALRPTIETWLKQDRPIHALIERRDIQSLARSTWNLKGKDDEVGQALFRVFIFDQWLERFNVNFTVL